MNQPSGACVPGRVLVVSGPPGAGKSTVSRLLADALTPSVHLHGDDFWQAIRRGWIAPYLPAADRQNKVVMDVLAGAAFGYATGGYEVVLDGVIGPWFLDVLRSAGRRSNVRLHYVVLRPDERTALARATTRGDGALTDPGPIRDLHRQFSDLGEFERHALDSGRLTAEETAAAILRGIGQGHYLLAGGGVRP